MWTAWRKIGERIIIGDQTITIQIVDIHRGQAKLGFEAEKSIPIHRAEVQRAAQRIGPGAEQIAKLLADEEKDEVAR